MLESELADRGQGWDGSVRRLSALGKLRGIRMMEKGFLSVVGPGVVVHICNSTYSGG